MDIWKEARRRCKNHLRVSFVEAGMKASQVSKLNLDKQVDELLSEDDGEYVRVAFVRLKMEIQPDDEE